MSQQLPLAFRLRGGMRFDNFVAGDNEQVVASLQALLADGERQLFLSGPPGSGKTHLLSALCALAEEQGWSTAYLPLQETATLSPALLENLEQLNLIAMDDIQAVAAQREWEEALFALYNRARDTGCHLVFAADAGPASLPLQLADLRSRLSWGLSFQLRPLDDRQKIELLIGEARQRGMELNHDVARYLLNRCPRDPASLIGVVEQLDSASLAAQRRLTLPFVREQLERRS